MGARVVTGLGHALFLASHYMRSAPGRSAVLILGTTLALLLPWLTFSAAGAIEDDLLSRAEASPILLGRKGNEFDLSMSSLYFRGQVRDPVPYALQQRVEQRGYGLAVPLHVVHSAGGAPVVGTSLEYLEQRGLELARGRTPALLAEVLAGAQVADEFALSVGDAVRSDLNNLYNLAGSYPVLLEVVGILQPSGTSDDEVFFCDVKTAWVLDGSLHGHDEVTRDNALNLDSAADSVAAGQPQRRVPTGAPEGSGSRTEPDNLEASPAMFVFSELTSANRSSFHFHGDPGVLPVTSVLVFPRDPRAFDQLLGDFVLDEDYQAVEPATVIRTILGIVLRVRDGLVAWFGLVAFSTVCFFVLVLSLSLRLRAAELALMKRIGCSRSTVTTVVGVEVAIILGASVLSAAVLTRVGLIFVRAVTGG